MSPSNRWPVMTAIALSMLSMLTLPVRARAAGDSSREPSTSVVLPGDDRLDGGRLVPHRATWRVTIQNPDGGSTVEGLWTDTWVRSEENGRSVVEFRTLFVDTRGEVLVDMETVFDATSFRALRSTQDRPPKGSRVSYRYEGDAVSGTLRPSADVEPRPFEVVFDEPVFDPLAPMLMLFPFETLEPETVLRFPIWNQGPGDDVTWRTIRMGSTRTLQAPDGSKVEVWSHTAMDDAAPDVVYRVLRSPEPPYWWWLRSERPGITREYTLVDWEPYASAPVAEATEESPAADETRPLELDSCRIDGLEQPARCGTLRVSEDPAAPEGRRIPLRVIVLPATGGEAAPDPIVFLTGGPGQAATARVREVAEQRSAARVERELVFMDQRGTGRSNPLRCELPAGTPPGQPFTPADVRDCRNRLDHRADLRRYTTPHAAADLEAMRVALGYERINLDAGSYGTRLALVYIRRYPDRVRSAVLRGVAPIDYRNPLPFSRAGQEALEKLFDACGRDPSCAAAYPDLEDDFATVASRLARQPVRVELSADGEAADEAEEPAEQKVLELTRELFMARVHLILFNSGLSSRLPFLIHRAARGDHTPFVRLAAAFGRAIRDQIFFGLQLSVVCSEDLPRITEREVTRETPGTFLGRTRIDHMRSLCREWVRDELPAGYWEPVRASTPTLLVSGALDPATPPRFAAAVARHLPRSRHLVLEESTHIIRNPCVERIVADFFSAGSAAGLDTSCIEGIRRPPFFVPDEVAPSRGTDSAQGSDPREGESGG